MTREKQRLLKELKNAVPQIIKEEIKIYKIKKKDYMIWYKNEDLFFDVLIDVRFWNDIQKHNIDSFYANINVSGYGGCLRRYLVMVHDGRYEEVLEALKHDDHGHLCNAYSSAKLGR